MCRLQRLYLEMNKDVFSKNGVLDGDAGVLESKLKKWFSREENNDITMDKRKRPK